MIFSGYNIHCFARSVCMLPSFTIERNQISIALQ